MSKLQQAFAKSRRQMNGRAASTQGNIVLKATEFTDSTVKGEVMTGPTAGQSVEIKVPEHGGKTVGIKEFTKKSHKAFIDTEKGGTLRVEKVSQGEGDVLDARWMKSFNGKPEDAHSVRYDAVSSFTTIPARSGESVPKMRVNMLDVESDTHVDNVDDFQKAIQDAFEKSGHAFIFCDDEGQIISTHLRLGGKKVDDEWVPNDAAETAAEIIASFGDDIEDVKRVLADTGFSVVPAESYTIGADTAENIHETLEDAKEQGTKPRIQTIDPETFKILPLGVRTQIALNMQGDDALPKDAGDKLKARFLETSDEDAKAAFHKSGWRGVSDDDMRRFFFRQGVDLKDHGDDGWSRQSILFKGNSAIKSFGQPAAVPYPNVKACEEANKAFRTEVRDAVSAAIDAPAKKAESSTETEAPKQEATASKTAEKDAGGDDLDAMLNGLEDSDLDDEQQPV